MSQKSPKDPFEFVKRAQAVIAVIASIYGAFLFLDHMNMDRCAKLVLGECNSLHSCIGRELNIYRKTGECTEQSGIFGGLEAFIQRLRSQ